METQSVSEIPSCFLSCQLYHCQFIAGSANHRKVRLSELRTFIRFVQPTGFSGGNIALLSTGLMICRNRKDGYMVLVRGKAAGGRRQPAPFSLSAFDAI
jgi:hypothetical protein